MEGTQTRRNSVVVAALLVRYAALAGLFAGIAWWLVGHQSILATLLLVPAAAALLTSLIVATLWSIVFARGLGRITVGTDCVTVKGWSEDRLIRRDDVIEVGGVACGLALREVRTQRLVPRRLRPYVFGESFTLRLRDGSTLVVDSAPSGISLRTFRDGLLRWVDGQ